MDFQHRMKRTAVGTIVQRSIADLKTDPKRALRRLADLGQMTFQGENQQLFVDCVQKAIEAPNSPYYELLLRVAQDANPETLRMLSMNLGYTSFTYGVRQVRAQQEVLRRHLPPFILFDLQKNAEDNILAKMPGLIDEARELGVFSFALDLRHDFGELNQILQFARKYTESTFLLNMPASLITEGTAQALGQMRNCMLALKADSDDIESAAALLQKNACVYGASLRVSAETATVVQTNAMLHQLGKAGCMYTLLIPQNLTPSQLAAMAQFVDTAREDAQLNTFPVNWQTDTAYLADAFSPGSDFLIWRRGGTIALGHLDMNVPAPATLRQAILTIMPAV